MRSEWLVRAHWGWLGVGWVWQQHSSKAQTVLGLWHLGLGMWGGSSQSVLARATAAREIWHGHSAKSPSVTSPKQTLRGQGRGVPREVEGSKQGCHLSLQGDACSVQSRHRTCKPLLSCRGAGPETCRVWLWSRCPSSQFQGSGYFSGGAEITNSAL